MYKGTKIYEILFKIKMLTTKQVSIRISCICVWLLINKDLIQNRIRVQYSLLASKSFAFNEKWLLLCGFGLKCICKVISVFLSFTKKISTVDTVCHFFTWSFIRAKEYVGFDLSQIWEKAVAMCPIVNFIRAKDQPSILQYKVND